MVARFSERRPATGGLGGEGALKLLGRPHLDAHVVLVREAVQNSWDAKDGDDGVVVEFELGIRTLTQRERSVMRSEIFTSLPESGLFAGGHGTGRELAEVLDSDQIRVLTLTDRGTHGLGGPVRADQAPAAGQPTDFIDLVFNIGQPPDKTLGGGTYGFGKTIAYLVSSCRTVLIHSRTRWNGRWQHRLIAQTIGNQYELQGSTYTGRHWWGVPNSQGVEPVTSQAARELGESMGLPSFGAGGGTTIAVIEPVLGSRTVDQAATFMANAIAWNFWPKMIASPPLPPAMTFRVLVEGREIPIPDPETTPPLNLFVEALRRARDDKGPTGKSDSGLSRVEDIRSLRPKAFLGRAAVVKGPTEPPPQLDEGTDDDGESPTAAAFTEPAHHIALMRSAELVVQYMEGPPLLSSDVQWAGVFRASAEADKAFAESEPPTHDEWRPKLVGDSAERTKVNVGLREIRKLLKEEFAPIAVEPESVPGASPVLVADRLGGLLLSNSGTGASLATRPPTRMPAPRRRARIKFGHHQAAFEDGRRVLRVDFDVEPVAGSAGTELSADVWAAAGDGGREADPPVDAPVPRVLGFERTGRLIEGATIHVPASESDGWTLIVDQPDRVAVALDVRAAPHDEAAAI